MVTGVVTGTITLTGKRPAHVYVYVVGDRDPPGTKRGRFQIAQKDRQFAPRVLVVPMGTRVDFPNLDKEEHNVFANEPVFFDLGRKRKQSYEFLDPGEFNVYCDIHEEMTAKVRVVPSSRFVEIAADGSYRIDVPVGEQRLGVWYPDESEGYTTRRFTVAEGTPVTMDFKVKARMTDPEPHLRIDGSPYPRRYDRRD